MILRLFVYETSGRSDQVDVVINAEVVFLGELVYRFRSAVADLFVDGVHLLQRRRTIALQRSYIFFELLRYGYLAVV